MTATTTTTSEGPMLAPDTARLMARGFVALRLFVGLIWFSNALAKVLAQGRYDLGFARFSLVDRASARTIATGGADRTYLKPLAAFYQHAVLPHWGFFGAFLTVAELAIGVGLLLGIATRLAAVGGLMLIGPIWLMLLNSGGYFWTYPLDLFPLTLLAIVPAGRVLGLDRVLAPRFGYRWPF